MILHFFLKSMLNGGEEGGSEQYSVHTHSMHTFVVAKRPPSVRALVTVTSTASDSVEREVREC